MKLNAHKINRPARNWAGLLLAFVLLACAPSALAQSEDGIKAAFVYNFAKFTTWPAQTFASASTPITVGFVGADSLADMFAQSVAGKNVNGHEFVIRRFPDATGVENCQMLFVGNTEAAAAVLHATLGKPILTVGDTERFASAGGMINLIKNGTKIRFDIDLSAVNAAQMKLDSRLCQLARNIKGR